MANNVRRSIIELLRLYRTLPALWDVNHEHYYDTLMKEQQYEILLEKYRETNPNANLKNLKRRINVLRTNYKRVDRRLKNAAKEGRRKKNTLYYFKELSFLNSIENMSPYGKTLQANKRIGYEDMVDDNKRPSIIGLLRVYRTLPALWDINHEHYYDTLMKEQQYEILLEKYRETNPNASLKNLKRRIHILRSTYWRADRRLENAAKEGRSEKHTLYYYKELSFLNSIKNMSPNGKTLQDCKYLKERNGKRKTYPNDNDRVTRQNANFLELSNSHKPYSCNQILPNNNIETEEMEIKPDLDVLSEKVTLCDQTLSEIECKTEQINEKYEISKLPQSVNTCNKVYGIESKQTKQKDDLVRPPIENYNQKEDTYQPLCSLWSQKFIQIGTSQQVFAEKLINDVLFHGELGLLNFNTSIKNLSPYQSEP